MTKDNAHDQATFFIVALPLLQLRGQSCSRLVVRRIIIAGRKTRSVSGRNKNTEKENTMQIHYLEIVTQDVEACVALYSRIHGVSFGVAEENLGGARTAKLANGGTLGIRAPMRDTETPVVRPYFLVHDIVKAVGATAESGAEIAMQPTEIAGLGKFAIVIKGGIESGLWQV
jgi:predicted enzyme related to lactoylglutathione lyase